MKKLDNLTALRFFAAASIVIEHSRAGFRSMDWIPHFHYDFGVSFFFVLSGFILCYTYRDFDKAGSLRNFYVARIARIWPLHLFMIGAFLVLLPAAQWFNPGTEGDHAAILLTNVFLIQSWIPIFAFYFGLNAVSWSISTEAFFYLVFPVLRHRWTRTWHWKTLSILIVAFGVLAIATERGIAPIDVQKPMAFSAEGIGYISPFVRIVEFVLGMLAANAYDALRKRKLPGGLIEWTAMEIGAVALVILINQWTGHDPGPSAWTVFTVECTAAPAFLVVVLVFAFNKGMISRAISLRPLVILGEASFALYLSHQLLYRLFDGHRSMFTAPDIVLCAGYWMAALIVSLALWSLIETPARDRIRKIASRPSSAGAAIN
jgi:peptidoglycan/LPS O-acetylase OafA/YrhL